MRVLNTTTFELSSGEQESFKREGYAILSHRWVGQEITFEQLPHHTATLRNPQEKHALTPQLQKIRGACELARREGIPWMWIDTCCINKASTVEETESINSMFKWYRDAKVCITYLFDVEMKAARSPPAYNTPSSAGAYVHDSNNISSIFQQANNDQPSEWFSRGWTLQELLAPHEMQFFDMNWNYMGTKTELAPAIQRVTGIEVEYLTGEKHFRKACIATKMSWQAGRTTAREEDIAYSMLGLFNIIMTPQYGEGSRAFMRLQQALLSTTTDESLFAWKMPKPSSGEKYDIEHHPEMHWSQDEWGLLAPTPDWFADCGRVTIEGGVKVERPSKGFAMTRQGLQLTFPPAEGAGKYMLIVLLGTMTFVGAIPSWIYVAKKMKKKAMSGLPYTLNCWSRNANSEFAAVQIYVQPIAISFNQSDATKCKRIRCSELARATKYATRGDTGEGFVVQPELRYDN